MVRTFPRQMGSLEQLVTVVREFVSAEGLNESLAFDLDLVIEELFSNLVRHGRSGHDTVEVTLERSGAEVVLILREYDAEPFDPTVAPEVDVTRPIEDRRPGGLGIHFVRVLSRRFQYDWHDRVGTTTVTMRAGE